MVIVVFEFEVSAGKVDRYFELAAAMREEIESQPGFKSIERFESLAHKGRFVSVSTWEDEAAVNAWRQNLKHQEAQDEGRASIFSHYRLRVAEVIRDYTVETSPHHKKKSDPD